MHSISVGACDATRATATHLEVVRHELLALRAVGRSPALVAEAKRRRSLDVKPLLARERVDTARAGKKGAREQAAQDSAPPAPRAVTRACSRQRTSSSWRPSWPEREHKSAPQSQHTAKRATTRFTHLELLRVLAGRHLLCETGEHGDTTRTHKAQGRRKKTKRPREAQAQPRNQRSYVQVAFDGGSQHATVRWRESTDKQKKCSQGPAVALPHPVRRPSAAYGTRSALQHWRGARAAS